MFKYTKYFGGAAFLAGGAIGLFIAGIMANLLDAYEHKSKIKNDPLEQAYKLEYPSELE